MALPKRREPGDPSLHRRKNEPEVSQYLLDQGIFPFPCRLISLSKDVITRD